MKQKNIESFLDDVEGESLDDKIKNIRQSIRAERDV